MYADVNISLKHWSQKITKEELISIKEIIIILLLMLSVLLRYTVQLFALLVDIVAVDFHLNDVAAFPAFVFQIGATRDERISDSFW